MRDDPHTRHLSDVTVLFSGIRSFSALVKNLDGNDVAELLARHHALAQAVLLENGGSNLQFAKDHGVSVFTDARRAMSAALALVQAADGFRRWLAQRFELHGLPPFTMGIGLHCGDVAVSQPGTEQRSRATPMGQTVNIAARLQAATGALGWSVAASGAVLARAGDAVQTGARASLPARGKLLAMEAHEITGLAAHACEINAAVKINSDITARITKTALNSRRPAVRAHGADAVAKNMRFKGYRVIQKIGSGGMTEVYLAERCADRQLIALKVIDAHRENASTQIRRLAQEYALVSTITYPHVVQVYEHGLTDHHAYIAMEYFECGDLRQLLGAGLSQRRALDLIKAVAHAIDAVHKKGVVHCDIKPENIMVRVDGSIALADFGIARRLLSAEAEGEAQLQHGDTIGTPYYLSPEQSSSNVITPQSDLYSLGVMMFEMLAGQRPFAAESLDMLRAQHLHTQTPALPPAHANLQAIVNKLMHKRLALRYASAQELLADLNQLQ